MKRINVAITGADGFLGRHLVSRLEGEQHIVVSLFDRNKYNLLRLNSLEFFLKDVDVVIHLAGVNRDSDYNLFKINALGTVGLLEGILSYSPNAKLILSSSFQIYKPESMYGLSKKFAEELIEYYSIRYDLRSIILRVSNIYGPGGRPFYNSVVATFVHQAKRGELLKINGDGTQKRDYIYVEDVVGAIIQSIHYNTFKINVQYFNICSGVLTSINEIIKLLRKTYSKKIKIKYNKAFKEREWENEKPYSNIQSKRFLSWRPAIPLEDGLRSMFD